MKKKMLIQVQLSNYDSKGIFILEADSGWQMVMGRVRIMLELDPDLHIDVMGPLQEDYYSARKLVKTFAYDVNPDLWEKYGYEGENRLRYISHKIIPNAIATRYDFEWFEIVTALDLGMHKIDRSLRYDYVYVNDPMHLRNFKTIFHIVGGYQPKFVVHSHFVDVPSCPKFPQETSLWLGQCEAAIKADVNFWQCESALLEFEREARKIYKDDAVDEIMKKSHPWDDGYSIGEINHPINMDEVRFSENYFSYLTKDKIVIFVPNRIGGRGRSSDYTNCGKFMFDILPLLKEHRKKNDYVVIAGNPSQKFSNNELVSECGINGYVNLVPDSLNREEFKYVASRSNIAVGLYDQDTYGGTAARECIELGCLPFWVDCNEYSSIAKQSDDYPFLCKKDFSNAAEILSNLIDLCKSLDYRSVFKEDGNPLQQIARERCSYESTTRHAMKIMGML